MCDYCHTVLRITETGIEIYKKQFLNRRPPKGIRIDRSKTGSKLTIPMQIQGVKIRRGPLMGKRAGFVFGSAIATGLICWAIFEFKVPFTIILGIMLAVMTFLGYLLSPKTFILLQDGVVHVPYPLAYKNYKTPIAEIKQLYVTVNRLAGKGTSYIQYNLFALKKDGARVRLYSDFTSLEAALYVEEWLEIELDIFNLPVYGDVQTRTADMVDFQSQPDEQITCYACAAPLYVTTAVRQQGYLTCAYCHTITLLYIQDSHRLILGQPNPAKMIYRVLTRGQFAGVLQKKEKQAVLLLSGNKIREAHFNRTLSGKAVTRFGIRRIVVPRELTLKEMFSEKLMAQYEQALAYSQDASLVNEPLDFEDHAFNTVQYMIRGQIGSTLYPLIPAVEDLHEAAFIVTTLNDYLDRVNT